VDAGYGPRRHCHPERGGKKLAAEGTDRHQLGREKFIEAVWEWREEYGNAIINQLKRLGASCDWDRERFTMDEGLSRAVRKVFVQLYEEGLIYQGDYIINWCCRCHTALSDLEVEHEELDGHLYHIRYPYADGSRARSPWPPPGRKPCWATRPWRSTRKTNATRSGRLNRDPAADESRDPHHPDAYVDLSIRHRRPQGDPGPRPQRL
jgi:isoleucyl-tRNA synthetase